MSHSEPQTPFEGMLLRLTTGDKGSQERVAPGSPNPSGCSEFSQPWAQTVSLPPLSPVLPRACRPCFEGMDPKTQGAISCPKYWEGSVTDCETVSRDTEWWQPLFFGEVLSGQNSLIFHMVCAEAQRATEPRSPSSAVPSYWLTCKRHSFSLLPWLQPPRFKFSCTL